MNYEKLLTRITDENFKGGGFTYHGAIVNCVPGTNVGGRAASHVGCSIDVGELKDRIEFTLDCEEPREIRFVAGPVSECVKISQALNAVYGERIPASFYPSNTPYDTMKFKQDEPLHKYDTQAGKFMSALVPLADGRVVWLAAAPGKRWAEIWTHGPDGGEPKQKHFQLDDTGHLSLPMPGELHVDFTDAEWRSIEGAVYAVAAEKKQTKANSEPLPDEKPATAKPAAK
jgi:hypothetical protein